MSSLPDLVSAEFDFGSHVVCFTGDVVVVRVIEVDTNGLSSSQRAWGYLKNPWTSKVRKEDHDVIVCREFKPRLKDAKVVLERILNPGRAKLPKIYWISGEEKGAK